MLRKIYAKRRNLESMLTLISLSVKMQVHQVFRGGKERE